MYVYTYSCTVHIQAEFGGITAPRARSVLSFFSAFRFPLSVPSGLFVSDNLIDKMTNLCMYLMYVLYIPDVGSFLSTDCF